MIVIMTTYDYYSDRLPTWEIRKLMNILEIRSPFGKEQAAVKMIYLNGVRLFWLIFVRTDNTISAVGSLVLT